MKMIKERYLNRLEKNRGYSENTIRTYRKALQYFDSFLIKRRKRSIEDCEKINNLDIDSFFCEETNKKSIKSSNVELTAIKGYLKYCCILGKKVMNTDGIIRGKEVDKKIECLEDYDSKKLLDYFRNLKANNKRELLINKRNFCICWLLLYTGIRISELSNLKRNQIKSNLQIVGKGGKLRSISLFDEDLKVINDYLDLRKDKEEDLFISFSKNYKSKKLHENSIRQVIRLGGIRAGLSERVRPHKLRHTFATNLLRNGAKLEHISKLLGHNSLSTTEIYLTIENREIRQSQSLLKRF